MMSDASPMNVWLVEDDPDYRASIAAVVNAAADMQVARTIGSCREVERCQEVSGRPDVVLQDVGLPDGSGIGCVRMIRARFPESRVLMLTVHEDESVVFQALCAGASGYLIKNASVNKLRKAIREVHHGGVIFSPSIASQILRHFETEATAQHYGLSPRERQVLSLFAEGYRQREIAEQLFISRHTVDTHLRHVYSKLHVRNGAAAISKAIREHLI